MAEATLKTSQVGHAASFAAPNFSGLWAGFGAVVLTLSIYCFASWILGGTFTPNTYGREDVPGWLRIWIRSIETLSALAFVWCNYKFIYKPWRVSGEISFDGLMIFACSTVFWQDVVMNYTVYYAQLNTYFINFGSWYNHIPGWVTPNAEKIPESIVGWGAAYGSWFVIIPVIVGNAVLRKCRETWPSMSWPVLMMVVFFFFVVVVFALEFPLVRTTAYTYGGAIKALSLFPDEVYRFPVYEPVLWGGVLTSYTLLYHLRDDKGFSLVERGFAKLKISKSKQKFLRFLALTGFVNAVFLAYNAIMIVISMNGDAWPENMPKYLSGGVCGTDQAYLCPGPETPIARSTSITNRTISHEELNEIISSPNSNSEIK